MKTVLIIGASGVLGRNLVQTLRDEETCVIGVGRAAEKIPAGEKISALTTDAFFASRDLDADLVVNCAFSRGNQIASLIAALDFNERLIDKLKKINTGSIVNISSQGIYRAVLPGEFLDEEGEIEPKEMYALAKYAQERLFTSNFGEAVTNIRMASLSANARFLTFFVDCVMQGKDIVVTAPRQYVSMIDVKDAAEGIGKVLALPDAKRAAVYNLGTGKQQSILEIAELTNEIGGQLGYPPVQVRVEDGGKQSAIGMDCARLLCDTGWRPGRGIREMIGEAFAAQRGGSI